MGSRPNVTLYRVQLVYLIVCVGLLGAPLSCSQEDQKVTLRSSALEIEGSMHQLSVPYDSIVTESLQIISIAEDEEFAPHRRLWGIGQPGIKNDYFELEKYLEGWFKLANGEVAFVLISQGQKAVYLRALLTPPQHVNVIADGELDRSEATIAVLIGTNDTRQLLGKLEDALKQN